jgi:choline dehydrogenase-like flavoprotein
MLIDSSNICSDLKTKVCIVGSGVAGGTAAKKLAELDADFIVVEAGGLKGESTIIQKRHVGRDFGLRRTTSIQLGGTSNYWHGVLSPLDEIDFKKREWIPHSGWPISLDDLKPHYIEAAKLLGVDEFDFFYADTLTPELKDQLQSLKFNREFLVNKLFQQPLPCINFKHVVRDVTQNSTKCHCYYNAAALELITNEAGDRVTKLLVGSECGNKFYIEAESFIIAAGVLETPRLLLNSDRGSGNELGNAGDNVGRYLADHPMGNLCQLEFLKPQKAHIYSDYKFNNNIKMKSGFELTENHQKELKLPNHNFFLRPSFIKGIDNESEKVKLSLLLLKDSGVTFSDFFRIISNLSCVRQILAYKLSLNVTFKYADLFFVTEQLPNPNSRITLSTTKDQFGYPISEVCWQLLPEDIEGIKTWFHLLLSKLFPLDYYRFTHSVDDFEWNSILTSAIHHTGTARMAENESNGVVDKNQMVFGVNNLFICDASVFTTPGNANISLSTSAFACRLVHYLSSQGNLR